MLKTKAIIHAPGANDSELWFLEKKFEGFLHRINLNPPAIEISPHPAIEMNELQTSNPLAIIIGWGLNEKPCWREWAYEINTSSTLKIFIAIDLYERHGDSERTLTAPNVKVGQYWWHKSWQTKCVQFLKDCYIGHIAPYGMKIITKNFKTTCLKKIGHRKLEPGSQEEIEILRLIFNLYVDHGYTCTEISNLLIAQGVQSPGKTKSWNMKLVKSLMETPVYIGSNPYGSCLKHDVFPALIEKSTFCEAQARIYGKEAFAPAPT